MPWKIVSGRQRLQVIMADTNWYEDVLTLVCRGYR
jgi:hypothetical protein